MTLVDQLILHEDIRLKPYRDTRGKLTIGVGRNLTDCGISRDEAIYLLDNDIAVVHADLQTFAWWADLDPVRQQAISDLRFNVGPGSFRGMTSLLTALDQKDYRYAAERMRAFKWAQQVGRRAQTLARMVESGDA